MYLEGLTTPAQTDPWIGIMKSTFLAWPVTEGSCTTMAAASPCSAPPSCPPPPARSARGPARFQVAALHACCRFGDSDEADGCAGSARRQSRCAGALPGAWTGDTGGKSGRRPGRHLQVEASGPGNAASVQQRLAGRFGGKFEAEGWLCGARRQSRCAGACLQVPMGRASPLGCQSTPQTPTSKFFFSPAPPIEPCGASSLAQMAGPSVSGAWSFQAHLQASDLGHP